MKKTSIGGQALIEGIMMRGPSKISIAIRKPDQEIEIKTQELESLSSRYKIFGMPFIRGIIGLFEAMYIGVNALMYSASFYDEDQEEMNKFQTSMVIITSVLMAVGLFMLLPNFLVSFFFKNINSSLGKNIIEGFFRIAFFLGYIYYVSKLEDIKRVFEYHGAEHKSIHCYEHEEELTVENIKKYPIMHKRCGTSFLFMVMAVSILVLSFFGWPNPLMRIITRIIALPIVAGISYEINRQIGRRDGRLFDILAYPGLMIQKYATVKEPDDSQIEVAIKALEEVLPNQGEDDTW